MNLTNEFIKVLKLKHTDKGHFGEQLGMAWLLKNGYWVFKNLAPQGPIDCVAVKQGTGEVVLVDIKVLSRHKNGYIRLPNVNMVEEMVDLIQASRAYEANVTMMTAIKNMAKKAMEI